MTGPRLLHAADLHLGAPLASLCASLDPARADHLRRLARGALTNLVDAAIGSSVEAVVLSGDVYDDAHREVGAQVRLASEMRRLHEADIPTFVVHGNHDPSVGVYRPSAALPGSVTVFDPGDVQEHEVELSDGSVLSVAGVSFGQQHERENLAQRFTSLRCSPLRSVGVLHANVSGLIGHDPYAPCTEADLARAPVGYWALGHVHQRTVRSLGPGRWWAYPGNLQGRSVRASECGPKGALLVPVGADGFGEPEFVALDCVRFERVDIDITPVDDLGDALDLLAERAVDVVRCAGERPVLLRVGFTGATRAHDQLRAVDDLRELAAERLRSVLGLGEVVKVDVATAPAIDRSRLADRADLLSALLRAVDELRADPAALDVEFKRSIEELDPSVRQVVGELAEFDPGCALGVLDMAERRLIDEMVERP